MIMKNQRIRDSRNSSRTMGVYSIKRKYTVSFKRIHSEFSIDRINWYTNINLCTFIYHITCILIYHDSTIIHRYFHKNLSKQINEINLVSGSKRVRELRLPLRSLSFVPDRKCLIQNSRLVCSIVHRCVTNIFVLVMETWARSIHVRNRMNEEKAYIRGYISPFHVLFPLFKNEESLRSLKEADTSHRDDLISLDARRNRSLRAVMAKACCFVRSKDFLAIYLRWWR